MTKSGGYGFAGYVLIALALGGYFGFAAIQGDLGVLKRAQILADVAALSRERDDLAAQVAELDNKTRRLSDSYLDLDLLDERAREVLGMMRADELTVR